MDVYGKTKRELQSQFSYNRLWKPFIDRDIKKKELKNMRGIIAVSIAKIGRCENVTTDVLWQICEALDCQLEDIVERVSIRKMD